MSIHLSAELGSDTVSTAGEDLTCEMTIRVDVDRADDNLPKHLALCIDSSYSMDGQKIEHAREGIKRAVDVLDDDDYVSVVEFSSSASLILDPTKCGSNRREIKSKVDSIETGNGTNIVDGLKKAKSALNNASKGGIFSSLLGSDGDNGFIEWIVIVSDGNPSSISDSISVLLPHKSKVERHISVAEDIGNDGVTIQSVGIGSDYNEEIMRGVAEATQGKIEHVSDPSEMRVFFEDIVEEASSIVGVNPTLQLRPIDAVEIKDIYQHEPVLNHLEPDLRRGTLQTDLPDIGSEATQKVLVEFEAPPDDPDTERRMLDAELEVAGDTATDSVIVTYSEEETSSSTLEDQKRIDTKARRLAIEESPESAASYLDQQDESDVLNETREYLQQLKRAKRSGDENEELKLKSQLSSPGLTKPSNEDELTNTGSSSEGENSDEHENGNTNSDETRDENPGVEDIDVEGSDTEETTANDEDVSPIDVDDSKTINPDVDPSEERPQESVGDQIKLALIPSNESVEVDEVLNLVVRDETGRRVSGATVAYPGGTVTTDDRGRCTVRITTPGDVDLSVTKEGDYHTDTITISVDTVSDDESVDQRDDDDSSTDSNVDAISIEDSEQTDEPTPVAPIPETNTVSPGESVEFTVRSAKGDRVAGAVIESESASGKTDNRGKCNLLFDSEGTYDVIVVDGPDAPYESKEATIDVK